jgi:hypothetical protein
MEDELGTDESQNGGESVGQVEEAVEQPADEEVELPQAEQ